jgi:predicted SAM-dependent methyltransferase
MALLESITRGNRRLNRLFFPEERVRYVHRFRELARNLSGDGTLVLHLGSGPVDLGADLETGRDGTALINLDLGLHDLQRNPGSWKVCADAGRLPFGQDRFDAICSEHVFEHFAAPEQVLAECFRVLKPGGSLVVSGPNGTSYIALAARFTSLEFHDSVRYLNREGNEETCDGFRTFYRFSTPRTIRRLARQSGFEVALVEKFVGEPCYTTFLPGLHPLFVAFHLVLEKLSPWLGFHITAVAVLRKPHQHSRADFQRLPAEQVQVEVGAH